MKYIANPVEVDAYKISGIGGVGESGGRVLQTEDMQTVVATKEMLARYTPIVGDYWVVQSDGYAYVNPKEVFERKYHRADGMIEIDAQGNVTGSPEDIELLRKVAIVRTL